MVSNKLAISVAEFTPSQNYISLMGNICYIFKYDLSVDTLLEAIFIEPLELAFEEVKFQVHIPRLKYPNDFLLTQTAELFFLIHAINIISHSNFTLWQSEQLAA